MDYPKTHTLFAVAVLLLTVATASPSHAQFSVLHNFGTKSGDGTNPSYSGIVAQGRDGNMYSTTGNGGTFNLGTVFKITPAGTLTVIYNLDGPHGSEPYGGLTLGTDGNFYGTAFGGGKFGYGTVFQITPGGTVTVLHNFASTDGSNPHAPPIQGTDGNFYGTTQTGGTNVYYGTVYKITPSGTSRRFIRSMLPTAIIPLPHWCREPTGTSTEQLFTEERATKASCSGSLLPGS